MYQHGDILLNSYYWPEVCAVCGVEAKNMADSEDGYICEACAEKRVENETEEVKNAA